GSCQARKPDEQARVARAEADPQLDARERLLRLTAKIKHYAEYGVCRGKAWVELDRFLELGGRAIVSGGPHRDQSKRKVGVRIARIERHRALRQLEGLLVISLGILGPAEIGRDRQRDRQRRGGLRILRIDCQRAAEIGLRL